MITIRRSEERGKADYGWLLSYHTFSFANYYDPRHMGFRVLRVINQDRVQPGNGFPMHTHREMEIISYVLEGALEHKDTMGYTSTIGLGEVQVISAGTGMAHSEYNPSRSQPVHFLQIWIEPNQTGLPPRYDQNAFAEAALRAKLCLVASPDGRDGSAAIRQAAEVYVTRLEPGQEVSHTLAPGRHAWVHVAQGAVRLAGAGGEMNGVMLADGDGAAVSDASSLTLVGERPAEVVVFDLP